MSYRLKYSQNDQDCQLEIVMICIHGKVCGILFEELTSNKFVISCPFFL